MRHLVAILILFSSLQLWSHELDHDHLHKTEFEGQNEMEFEVASWDSLEPPSSRGPDGAFRIDFSKLREAGLFFGLSIDEIKKRVEEGDSWILVILKHIHDTLYRTVDRELNRYVGDPWTLGSNTENRINGFPNRFDTSLVNILSNPKYMHMRYLDYRNGGAPDFMTGGGSPQFYFEETGNNKVANALESSAKTLLNEKAITDFAVYLASKTPWFPDTPEGYAKLKNIIIKYGMYPAGVIGLPAYLMTGGRLAGSFPVFALPGGWLGLGLCYSVSDMGIDFKPDLRGCARMSLLRFRMKGKYRENFGASSSGERRSFEGEISENWLSLLTRKMGVDVSAYFKTKKIFRYGNPDKDPKTTWETGFRFTRVQNALVHGFAKRRSNFSGSLAYDSQERIKATIQFNRITPSDFISIALGGDYNKKEEIFSGYLTASMYWRDFLKRPGLFLNFSLQAKHNSIEDSLTSALTLKDHDYGINGRASLSWVQPKDPNGHKQFDTTYRVGFHIQGSLESRVTLEKNHFRVVNRRLLDTLGEYSRMFGILEETLGAIYYGDTDPYLITNLRAHNHFMVELKKTLQHNYEQYLESKKYFNRIDPDVSRRNSLFPEEEELILEHLERDYTIDIDFIQSWQETLLEMS